MKKQRPQETKCLDGDLTARKRSGNWTRKFFSLIGFNNWTVSCWSLSLPLCTLTCAVHTTLCCVSKSDSRSGTCRGCILELDPVRNTGQEPATTSALEIPSTPAISPIVLLWLGRWKCSSLTVSFGFFRALQILKLPSGFFPIALSSASHHYCFLWIQLISPLSPCSFWLVFEQCHSPHTISSLLSFMCRECIMGKPSALTITSANI